MISIHSTTKKMSAPITQPFGNGSSYRVLVNGTLPSGVDLIYAAPISAKAKYNIALARLSTTNLPRGYPGCLPDGIFLTWNPQPMPRIAMTSSRPRSQRFQSGSTLSVGDLPPATECFASSDLRTLMKFLLRPHEEQQANRPAYQRRHILLVTVGVAPRTVGATTVARQDDEPGQLESQKRTGKDSVVEADC